jgi:hypothetical protein
LFFSKFNLGTSNSYLLIVADGFTYVLEKSTALITLIVVVAIDLERDTDREEKITLKTSSASFTFT